jgi:uncharacterized protein (DUF3820 family)
MTLPLKAIKCLTLALNDSAPDGEWNAAAIRFCSILRKNGIGIDFLHIPPPMQDAGPSQRQSRNGRRREKRKSAPVSGMPFGKFKGQPFRDIPDWYLNWCLDQDFIENPLRSQLEAEIERRQSEYQS